MRQYWIKNTYGIVTASLVDEKLGLSKEKIIYRLNGKRNAPRLFFYVHNILATKKEILPGTQAANPVSCTIPAFNVNLP